MKIVYLVALLSTSAFASTAVKLDMKLKLNGKETSPVVITNYGQEAKLSSQDEKTGDGVEISVLPTLDSKKNADGKQAVNLKFQVSEIKKGARTVVANSTVITHLGKSARITQEHKDNHSLSLEVVPTEVTSQ